ncbi:Methyltransferase domain-containing protein [Evansella caseinilytica]|uniref:Methyltransferase domain-containing protein n=1 Tax=Evansella caseinilytica TaxID=1503961 RepID=A0A1H3I863_9BACI|nr:class I SAM-dependent methyltransferase [Evansella caseinilytica]SDY23802.1 Methyltransferase domain-containing protein [Evansella caseinilytica]
MNDFFNAAMWETVWKDESALKIDRMKKNGIDPARSFDHKANTFNEQSFSEEGRKRTRRIMNWLEGQGVCFEDASVLDIGAASGVFTVPFAERGARITAVETSPPLIELLEENTSTFAEDRVRIVHEKFEDIDVQSRGWNQAFDLVFVSMSPVIHNWESVEKVLQCAKKFCYISMPVIPTEHSLVKEIWPLVTDKPYQSKLTEMGYLLHLLYLKGYAYESLITREASTKEVAREEALQEVMTWLGHHRLPVDERNRNFIADYLTQAYPSGKVAIQSGGRFGKVLIRLQDQSMYMREI